VTIPLSWARRKASGIGGRLKEEVLGAGFALGVVWSSTGCACPVTCRTLSTVPPGSGWTIGEGDHNESSDDEDL